MFPESYLWFRLCQDAYVSHLPLVYMIVEAICYGKALIWQVFSQMRTNDLFLLIFPYHETTLDSIKAVTVFSVIMQHNRRLL